MAITNVEQREIVEIPFTMPDGSILPHPALVISRNELQVDEDGMFYAVLISTKNYHPEYTIRIEDEWLNKPMGRQSKGSGDRYLNHLNTNKKWHVKQERIQIAEPLAQKEEEGLLDIEEAPVKTYYSDEEIWHVITTETGQGSAPSPVAADHRCFFRPQIGTD